MRRHEYADWTCPECKHVHEEIEYTPEGAGDRDAEYIIGVPVVETTKCSAPGCNVELCSECYPATCECGYKFCKKHEGQAKTCIDCREDDAA